MNISVIYEKYKTPPGLRNHQLRVAAVAQIIATKVGLSGEEIMNLTRYGLLHDMGNVVKANYEQPLCPEDWQEKERWQKTKIDYLKKYGTSAHDATIQIISEMGIGEDDIEFFESNRYGYVTNVHLAYKWKIAKYADLRVDPFGIVTLEKRLIDIKNRYKGNLLTLQKTIVEENHAEEFETLLIKEGIYPHEINDESCRDLVLELGEYEIIWN